MPNDPTKDDRPPAPLQDAVGAPRPRRSCPRCGAALGALAADAPAAARPAADALYCGCCGLVVPAA